LTPIGDISDYEDIANACWFFGTELSKNITGSELIVDGGMSCQLYPRVLNSRK
jgi:enoyl-[acyl-carrier-protein] reductase (NADH)